MDFFPDWVATELRLHQEASFPDSCVLLTRQVTEDAYGEEIAGPPQESDPTKCWFVPLRNPFTGNEQQTALYTLLNVTAKAYLPLGTPVHFLQGFRLTHRNGVALATPDEYDIEGEAAVLDTSILLTLRRSE